MTMLEQIHAAANTLLQAEAGKIPIEAVPLGEIARLLRSLATPSDATAQARQLADEIAGVCAQAMALHSQACAWHAQEPCTCDQPERMKVIEARLLRFVTPLLTAATAAQEAEIARKRELEKAWLATDTDLRLWEARVSADHTKTGLSETEAWPLRGECLSLLDRKYEAANALLAYLRKEASHDDAH